MMNIIYSILAGVFYSVSGYLKNNTAETFNVNKFIYTVGRALVYGILLFYAGISTANADMATDMIMNMLLVVGIDKIIMNFYTIIKTYLKK